MKRVEFVSALVLVAVAMPVSVASAGVLSEPEFGICAKQPGKTHEYKNSSCTKASPTGQGGYTWRHVASIGEGMVNGGATSGPGTLTNEALEAVHCKKDVLTPTGGGQTEWEWFECGETNGPFESFPSRPLTPKGGFLGGPKNVGVQFAPSTGTLFASAGEVLVRGQVIGELKPVNKMTVGYSIKFKSSKTGVQALTHLDGGPSGQLEESISGHPYIPFGIASVENVGLPSALEVRTEG